MTLPKQSIQQLADNTYQVGKFWSHTLFYDAGDYFIAAGGERDLKLNYQAVQEFTNTNKPLKYLVITHHHNSVSALAKEAVELGAKIITTSQHMPVFKDKTLTVIRQRLCVGQQQAVAGGKQVTNTGHSPQPTLVTT